LSPKTNRRSKPDKSLECIGLLCPEPVYRTRQALDELSEGDILEVITDDPAAEGDLSSFISRLKMQILEIKKDGDIIRFLIKK